MNKDQEYVRIAVLESIVEAQIVGHALEEEGVPHRIRSYHDTAYDGLFQFQKGWGEIAAPLPHKTRVLGILDDIRTESNGTGEWEAGVPSRQSGIGREPQTFCQTDETPKAKLWPPSDETSKAKV